MLFIEKKNIQIYSCYSLNMIEYSKDIQ